jgi:hypothetical protein
MNGFQRAASSKQSTCFSYLVFALIFAAIGIGLIVSGRALSPVDNAAAQVFASDPSCAVSLNTVAGLGNCTVSAATLLGAEVRYHGFGRTRAKDAYVTVRLADGTIDEAELDGSDGDLFVYSVKSGAPARAQFFHGTLVRVVSGDSLAETVDAPDVSAQADSDMPWVGAALLALASLFVFLGVRALLRPG